LGAFGVISILSEPHHDVVDINRLKGLFFRNPWIAIVLSLSMFSLAGIPLTAGFIAKFYIVLEGVRSNLWLLAVSLIINTVISLYYYLRIIKTMFSESGSLPFRNLPVTGHVVLAFVAAAILLLGILPSFLTNFLGDLIK
jgi:NADH-quinone oxidoreductase subunit N